MSKHDDSDTDQTEYRLQDISRRGFLQSGSAAVGGSLLGAGLADQASTNASASTSPSASAADFAQVRQNYRDIQIGYNPDGSDPYIDQKVTTIEDKTSNGLDTYNTTDSNKVFDDINLDDGQLQIKRTYTRLRWMAWGYKSELSSYYNDTSLRDKIIDGMKLIYNEDYFSDTSDDTLGFYEKVANPRRVIDLTILMYSDLSSTWRSNFAATVDYHNDFLSIASDRSDTDAGTNSVTQLGLAAVREDAELLEKAAEFPETVIYKTGPPGSGHYPDGTKLAHQDHPYNTGMYGGLGNETRIVKIVDGTQWDGVSWADNLYEVAIKAYIGAMYDGAGMCGFQGRAISRHKITVYNKALKLLHVILRAAEAAPAPVGRRIKEMVKYHVQAPDSLDLRDRNVPGRPLFISEIELMNDLMNDDSISARPEQFTPKVFDNADRQVVKANDFAAEISAYSSRISTYEGKNENLKSWHKGRGMTLLHTSDEQQFIEDMWPTIDWYRLPGTTVVNKPLSDEAYESQTSSEDWVGGSNLDAVGAFGMSLGPDYTDMSGKKSWLTIGGDQIVCLGTGISNTDSNGATETTLINRKLNSAGDNTFVVDGTSQSSSLGWSDTLSDPSWAWLDGTGGYYFPDASDYQAKREERSGAWDEINNDLGGSYTYTNNFLTVWQDHGTAPSGASYEYVLLPERTQSETSSYASSPGISVLENSTSVQAVESSDGSQFAANFWSSTSVGNVSTDSPVSVSVDDSGDTTEIAVSDPTHNQYSATVELPRVNVFAAEPRCKDSTVSITGYDPLTLEVDFLEEYGEAQTVTFGDYCTFVDPGGDLTKTASGTDSASLTTVNANPENFNRLDGSHDDDRMRRDGTTADVPIVYDPPGTITDLDVEFHYYDGEGGSLDVYESTDGGSTWTQVSQSVTQYDTGAASGWKNEVHEYSSFSDGTDKVKLVLTGGNKQWSGQVGHVEIGYRTPTLVDRCEDLTKTASGTDSASLTTVGANSENFNRLDGSHDDDRIRRDGTTADVPIVYDPLGTVTDLSVEFHRYDAEGGSLDIYETTDGGNTWTQVSQSVTQYDTGAASGWKNEVHEYSSFSDGTDKVKLVLTGGNKQWSGQVGHVKIGYNTDLVDRCERLTKTASGTDSASLTTVSANPENFNRLDGTHDDDRIRRDGTTADVPIVYDPPGTVSDLDVEFHYYDGEGGDLDIYESTDGGSTWTQVSQSVTQYDTGATSSWKNELHEYRTFSDGANKVKLVITGGNSDWSGQIGQVEINDSTKVVDPIKTLRKTASGTDSANLELRGGNSQNFHRRDGTDDGDRVLRDGTTADVPIVYDPPGTITDLDVEFHRYDGQGASLDIYESTDGGSTWTQVSQSVTQYDTGDASGWKNELHEYSTFSDGTDQVKLVLADGNEYWSCQMGYVEIDVD